MTAILPSSTTVKANRIIQCILIVFQLLWSMGEFCTIFLQHSVILTTYIVITEQYILVKILVLLVMLSNLKNGLLLGSYRLYRHRKDYTTIVVVGISIIILTIYSASLLIAVEHFHINKSEEIQRKAIGLIKETRLLPLSKDEVSFMLSILFGVDLFFMVAWLFYLTYLSARYIRSKKAKIELQKIMGELVDIGNKCNIDEEDEEILSAINENPTGKEKEKINKVIEPADAGNVKGDIDVDTKNENINNEGNDKVIQEISAGKRKVKVDTINKTIVIAKVDEDIEKKDDVIESVTADKSTVKIDTKNDTIVVEDVDEGFEEKDGVFEAVLSGKAKGKMAAGTENEKIPIKEAVIEVLKDAVSEIEETIDDTTQENNDIGKRV